MDLCAVESLLSAAIGSCFLSHPRVGVPSGPQQARWLGSTAGCEIWLNWQPREWGNCHSAAWGLGQGQWADAGLVGG